MSEFNDSRPYTQSVWDQRFLALARHVAQWSKDPSTKCGAVVADGKRVVSLGFNGLAAGVPDEAKYLQVREAKYKQIIHADLNAILHAREPLRGLTLYTYPFMPCSRCCATAVQVGIARIVAPWLDRASRLWSAWDCDLTVEICLHAGVNLIELDMEAAP